MRSVLAAGVAELDADNDHAGRSQVVAPAAVGGAGGLEHGHPAAVEMEHTGQVGLHARRAVHEHGHIVAIDTGDDLDAALDTGHRRQAGDETGEQSLEALLGLGDVGQQLVERRRRVERERLRLAEAKRLHRGDHPRIGSRVLAQRHRRRAEAPGQNG